MAITFLMLTVCFLAYSNGSNDNFKGVASLFGSGVASYKTALVWATITTFAGSICALLLAQTLLLKFSGKGIAPDALIQSIPFITAVATGAGLTVILASRFGFPISTTHALLGALSGSTFIATNELKWSALSNSFIMPLLLSPAIALLLAMLIYFCLRAIKQANAINNSLCVCLENKTTLAISVAASESGQIMLDQNQPYASLTVDSPSACENRASQQIFAINFPRMIDSLHFLSAGAVCFARGLNDTPKIAALLLLAPGLELSSKIILIASLMALGGVLGAKRVAETMSHKITTLSHGQGLSANLTTAFLVICASKFGLPVSTTHVSVGALFGIGMISGHTNYRMVASILLSWLLTLPCAALSAAVSYQILTRVMV
ncbi:MAG: inorganic phosphate transporter [Methylococcaceae bacterium]|jgi:PiT family inorganic phosphate transporter